jgi:hypothetical protein
MNRWAFCFVALGGLGGCKVLDDALGIDSGAPQDPCVPLAAGEHLPSSWQIDGSGSRSSCSDPAFQGSFSLATKGHLDVTYDADASIASATTDVGVTASAAGFTLQGSIRGSCLSFQTNEQVGDDVVTYDFTGNIDSTTGASASGTFTGVGPGTCTSSGSFTLR